MRMRRTFRAVAGLFFGLAVMFALPIEARADSAFNFLAGSEFGRGVGAGFEFGQTNTLVVGAGTRFGLGHSSATGWLGQVDPGAAIGFRRYFSRWFIGPSVGVNYLAYTTNRTVSSRVSTTALVDFGYRWPWTSHPGWNTRLGISGGAEFKSNGDVDPAVALTFGVGFGKKR